jgi:hypothetical protein
MAIPSVGGGQQIGDGNLNELKIGVMPAPQTATSTATLTTAQILGGVLVGDPSTSAASYTLPTVADTEAVLVNAKVGSTFDLVIINLGTSSGIITVLVGTGWTLSGMVTLPITTSAGSSGLFRARKTGTGAWTMYRVS